MNRKNPRANHFRKVLLRSFELMCLFANECGFTRQEVELALVEFDVPEEMYEAFLGWIEEQGLGGGV